MRKNWLKINDKHSHLSHNFCKSNVFTITVTTHITVLRMPPQCQITSGLIMKSYETDLFQFSQLNCWKQSSEINYSFIYTNRIIIVIFAFLTLFFLSPQRSYDCANAECQKLYPFPLVMHPLRGPKGRGVAPIGATRGVLKYLFTFFGYYMQWVCIPRRKFTRQIRICTQVMTGWIVTQYTWPAPK